MFLSWSMLLSFQLTQTEEQLEDTKVLDWIKHMQKDLATSSDT